MTDRAKKILRNILFLLSIPMIIGAYVYAQTASKKEICKGINVVVENPEINFVTQSDIQKIITKQGVQPNTTLIKNINCKNIETQIENNKWVKYAELFVTPNSEIHVTVHQKVPVVRLQQKDSIDYAYYLDENANPIMVSQQFVANVPIVTTHTLGYTKNDLDTKTSLVRLAQFIQKDTFWNAFIAQIDLNNNKNISMVPAFGNQEIILGTIEDLENKMDRLFIFYQQGMATIHWSLYDEIDLRFKGQIVCRNTHGEILAEDPYDKTLNKKLETVIKNIETKKPEKQKENNPKPLKTETTKSVKKLSKP